MQMLSVTNEREERRTCVHTVSKQTSQTNRPNRAKQPTSQPLHTHMIWKKGKMDFQTYENS